MMLAECERSPSRTGGQPRESCPVISALLLCVSRACRRLLELLHIARGKFGFIKTEGQLVNFAGKLERDLIVLVVRRRAGVAADVEGLVPRHGQRYAVIECLRRNHLAIDLERAGATFADAADIVEGQSTEAEPVILEVVLQRVLTRCERLRAWPLHALEIEQIPGEDGFPFQQIQTIAAETSAIGDD